MNKLTSDYSCLRGKDFTAKARRNTGYRLIDQSFTSV